MENAIINYGELAVSAAWLLVVICLTMFVLTSIKRAGTYIPDIFANAFLLALASALGLPTIINLAVIYHVDILVLGNVGVVFWLLSLLVFGIGLFKYLYDGPARTITTNRTYIAKAVLIFVFVCVFFYVSLCVVANTAV